MAVTHDEFIEKSCTTCLANRLKEEIQFLCTSRGQHSFASVNAHEMPHEMYTRQNQNWTARAKAVSNLSL